MPTNVTGFARAEGSKGYLIFNVPAAAAVEPGWIRAAFTGYNPVFCWVRNTRDRRMGLPAWNFPSLKAGDPLVGTIEPAAPFRAHGTRSGCFDWNAFVADDAKVLATEEPNGILRLWTRHAEPFDLLRCPPAEPLYRLLGFYQAEGSKSASGLDFSFANSNVELIRNAIENLAAIGVGAGQLYAEILHGVGETRESAIAKYASLPVEVHAVRPRTGRGSNSYVLHARNSLAFRKMVNAALAQMFTREFPSKETALTYTLGWLDGDGSITRMQHQTELRLAGLPEEHVVVCRALNAALGWSLKDERYRNNKDGTHISLRAAELLDLIEAGAFRFSMSYVRLLLGFDAATAGLRSGVLRGSFVRWGLRASGGQLTVLGTRLIAAYAVRQAEIEEARRLETDAPHLFGVKGVPNPLMPKREASALDEVR
jgi:hypothetical protein